MSTTPELEVVELDPFDEPMLAAWHGAYAAALDDAVGDAALTYTLPELRVQVQQPTSDRRLVSLVGLLDGQVVASGAVGLPLRDNLTSAYVEVAVAPAHQERGLGRAMADAAERYAADAGRTLLDTQVRWRWEEGAEGEASRGARFARARGYRLGLSDVQRRLPMPVDDGLLDALAAEAAPHHTAYELRAWVGPVPDELAEDWVALDSGLMTEAPMGDLELEPADADVALLREQDVSLVRQGRTQLHAVALDGVGRVVAYTMLVHGVHDSVRAFQWGTLVDGVHRGHRLGLALKVQAQRLLQTSFPDVRSVVTWNAEANGPMIGVNERLGYRPVARMGEFQRRLTA